MVKLVGFCKQIYSERLCIHQVCVRLSMFHWRQSCDEILDKANNPSILSVIILGFQVHSVILHFRFA